MKKPNEDKLTEYILAGLGVIPIVWAALMAAPFLSEGLAGIVEGFTSGMRNPMKVTWCTDSLKAICIFLVIYGMSLGVYYSTRRNYRKGEEHGSAKWGDPRQICRKYAEKDKSRNVILTQNVRIGLDGRKHRRNLNVLVVGGSGAGKTRFYAKPNVMQANTSYVVLDPKGEILRDTGYLLEQQGYDIKVLDLINTSRSHGFNPFVYLRDDKDVLRLVSNLIRNTTPKGAQSNDPFWERAETALLEALILYLVNEAPPEEQNFPMVMEMINAAEVKEEDEEYASVLDELFERLAMRDPEHLAVKQYHIFKLAAGVTLAEHTTEQFDLAVYSGLYATFYYMKACYPYLKETRGFMINFASGAGLFGNYDQCAYAAAKEGIRGLTRVAATEWGQDGINVHIVCPLAWTAQLEKFQQAYPEAIQGKRKNAADGAFRGC